MAHTTPDDGSDEQNIKTTVVSALREHDSACAVIERSVNGTVVPTVYTSFGGEFLQFSEASSPSKVKRHTMCEALNTAQSRGDNVRVDVLSRLEMDAERKVERAEDAFDTAETRDRAGYGAPKEHLDADDDKPLGDAASPIGTSDVHGGGW